MEACFGSFNTKGFSSSLDNYQIPEETHITYSGLFNQLNFSIGPKAVKPLELHLGYARAQNQHSLFDSKINDYLTVFTKGSKDGEDRDERVLNSVIILDISGSMGSGLTSSGQGCRIELAKEAILMFFSKLRQNDAFGLILFNHSAQTLIPVQRVSELNCEEVAAKIKSIQPHGGTTLMSGFNEANNQLTNYLNKTEFAKNSMENRMIMLTDVGDNSISTSKSFIQKVEAANLHTTIIGVSDDFRSQICQSLIEVKGFNYFCATEIEDLKRYLFQNFSFTFFPSNYNIEISIQSQNIESIEVFGTVDADKVPDYNKDAKNKFIITKTKSSFPSELEITEQGEVKTFGGLILIKLALKDKSLTCLDGKINLSYETPVTHELCHEEYPIRYESPPNEQFFSEESLYQAVSTFFYGFQSKNILQEINKSGGMRFQEYEQSLEKLRESIPESKKEELQKFIETVRKNGTRGMM